MRHTFPFEPRRMLAHYDAQSKEGSGVAVATGWQAAGHILGAAQ
jgi:glycerol-3-phosphate dehydrogenase subunit B